MIGIGIIAILSAIAILGYLEARNFGLRSAYANELRTTRDAFTQFAFERQVLPYTPVNAIPQGMDSFLPKNSTWTIGPDIGGHWAWLNMNTFGNVKLGSWSDFRGWVITLNIPISSENIAKLDQTLDDGSGTTGALRYVPSGNFYTVYFGVN